MSKNLTLAGILLTLVNASSHYNKSYDGYTFILPDAGMNGSDSRPMQRSFSVAQQWCKRNFNGSTLATIPNKDVQRDISDFLESALKMKQPDRRRYNTIRVNGKYHITDAWRWVNDNRTAGITVHERNDQLNSSSGRLLATNFTIYSENPHKIGRFICEYPGNSEQCSTFLNGRCYKKNHTSSTWYDARNNCFDRGGDLASFENLSDTNINVWLKNLSLDSYAYYWIGLQKNEWRWEDTGSTIKYTNWEIYGTSNYSLQCLCLTQSQWNWKECNCSEPYPFICMLNETSNSPTTPKPQNETIQFVIISVSCAVIFVAVIIIAAALIAKKRRNSNAPRAVKSSGYENPEHATVETLKDFPVYAEIQGPKETNSASNTVYASVQATAGTDQELPVNNVVYAELDLTSRA